MRTILFVLLLLTGLIAMISGMLLTLFPTGSFVGLSLTLLNTTPFNDYLVPGILLMVFVGGSCLVPLFYYLKDRTKGYNWAMLAGFVIAGWIIGQTVLLQSVNWLHIVFFGVGILIILMAYQLKGKWAV